MSAIGCQLSAVGYRKKFKSGYYTLFLPVGLFILRFMRNFQKLIVWQKSHALTLSIYQITKSFPNEEIFGLVSQMRRSSSSIPTNIAEGCGRFSNAELKRFFFIASGSMSELQYQLLLCKELGYIHESDFKSLNQEVMLTRKMLFRYTEQIG